MDLSEQRRMHNSVVAWASRNRFSPRKREQLWKFVGMGGLNIFTLRLEVGMAGELQIYRGRSLSDEQKYV